MEKGTLHPNLEVAVKEIRAGKISYRDAEKKWGVGKGVLQKYVKEGMEENKNHGGCLFTSKASIFTTTFCYQPNHQPCILAGMVVAFVFIVMLSGSVTDDF